MSWLNTDLKLGTQDLKQSSCCHGQGHFQVCEVSQNSKLTLNVSKDGSSITSLHNCSVLLPSS